MMKQFWMLSVLLCMVSCQFSNDIDNSVMCECIQKYASAAVEVKYFLKKNEGESPAYNMDLTRSGKDGSVDRGVPVTLTGYLVGDTAVVLPDIQLNPHFIARIEVVSSSDSVFADCDAFCPAERATRLCLQRPLQNTTPLAFETGSASYGLRYDRALSGYFVGQHIPLCSESMFSMKHHKTIYILNPNAIVMNNENVPVSLVMGNQITTADDCTPMHEWKWIPTTAYYDLLVTQKERIRKTLFPVRLNLKLTQEQLQGWRINSEFQTLGYVFKKEGDSVYMAVMHQLKPKHMATLTGITATDVDGKEYKGQFVAALKNWGIMIVTFDDLDAILPQFKTEIDPLDASRYIGMKLRPLNNRLLISANYASPNFENRTYGDIPSVSNVDDGTVVMDVSGAIVALPFNLNSPVYESRYGANDVIFPASVFLPWFQNYTHFVNDCNVPTANRRPMPPPWLGIDLIPLERTLAEIKGFDNSERDALPIITHVYPGSPADKAGLKRNDILVSWGLDPTQTIDINFELTQRIMDGDFPWNDLDELPEMYYSRIPSPFPPTDNSFFEKLSEVGAGSTIYLTYFREGAYQTCALTMQKGRQSFETTPRLRSKTLGVTVKNMTYEVRQYLNVDAKAPGVIICDLSTGGKSSVAGMKPFERITKINDTEIFNIVDFKKAIATSGDDIRVVVNRIGTERIVKMKKNASVKIPSQPSIKDVE